MTYVLDAHALTVYFEREPSYERVRELLTAAASNEHPLLCSTVNWGEVYYITYRNHSPEQADQVARLIDTFPIELIDIDRHIAKQAALFKVAHKMSYADCFAAALAKTRKATLVTGDKEFKSLEDEIKINWL